MSSGTTHEVFARRLKLLVLQPTPFCNIDCSYCYLSNRTSKARMSLQTLDLACRRIFESSLIGSSLDVAWHGGEPLTVPIDWYLEAVDLMAKRSNGEVELQHFFQTNGLLINSKWIRFFFEIGAKVGISIDGPADLHDANRRARHGRGTHEKVMAAVHLLQEHSHPFHVITVLTEHSLHEPERLFNFYVQNGIRDVGFNVEEIEGANQVSSLEGKQVEAQFREFVRKFFELVWASPGLVRVREFEDVVGLILSESPVRDQQNVPFSIVSIDYKGSVSTFSPELLGAYHPRFANFTFGDVVTHDIQALEDEPLFTTASQEIQRGVEKCKSACPYFRWCGGGAPANKLFETGRFDVSETMHCRLTRQILLDEVVAGLQTRIRAPRSTSGSDAAMMLNESEG
ncbi:GRRM system radical SAM/SPASM domain protein [Microvirga sp. BT688]|uniref:cyclophane-forming radical SAM/SPASM peptide maturase GrrM/OscB n=1 Tax=Microvirga sp. TaxID=1873136 RepID=UPI001684DCB4|nr:cyclophane-forming radical SAM/SPASM peptide maturase GrrM/OscB [Microvirga sp.]MBD2750751.1 GRRM system radical SAM/SPASM domain protein [Microvirga sp.]